MDQATHGTGSSKDLCRGSENKDQAVENLRNIVLRPRNDTNRWALFPFLSGAVMPGFFGINMGWTDCYVLLFLISTEQLLAFHLPCKEDVQASEISDTEETCSLGTGTPCLLGRAVLNFAAQ
jgi:hypothetical protein